LLLGRICRGETQKTSVRKFERNPLAIQKNEMAERASLNLLENVHLQPRGEKLMATTSTQTESATSKDHEATETTQDIIRREGTDTRQNTQSNSSSAIEEANAKSLEGAQPTQPIGKKPRWTVMVYIAADAVLANFGVESLKQLNEGASSPECREDPAQVVVAAQFSIDAPAGQSIPRYIFNQNSGGNLGRSLRERFDAPENMTEQEALTSFLDWVYNKQDICLHADNYALILWSHGPELFLQPPPGSPTGTSGSLYLTPVELRQAIEDGIPENKRGTLKVIGFDACSMSMYEMAYELSGLAGHDSHDYYMVASQEEVPDLSFPYSTLVQLIREYGETPQTLITKGVRSYVRTYQDYITNAITTMEPVTLSALRLNKCGQGSHLSWAINCLASSLLDSLTDPDLPDYLVTARAKSRDYAGGLYVDMVEFCTYLYQQLFPCTEDEEEVEARMRVSQTEGNASDKTGCDHSILKNALGHKKRISDACLAVLEALQVDVCGTSKRGAVLISCSSDTRSHGLSIYLPYLSDNQASLITQPVVKGTRDVPAKGFGDALNACASGYLMDQRQNLILDTEGYYDDLRLAKDTEWYEFIVQFWTYILISMNARDLDLRYSGVQSAINSIRKKQERKPMLSSDPYNGKVTCL
jgi:Clostripain family